MKMKTEECKNCHRRFRMITEEGICFYCYYEKYHRYPKEFQPVGKYKG